MYKYDIYYIYTLYMNINNEDFSNIVDDITTVPTNNTKKDLCKEKSEKHST